MNYTIFFTICSLFYSVLIGTAYFSKRRIKSVENKIFSWIIITNFIGIILELCCLITSLDYVKYSLINYLFSSAFISSTMLLNSASSNRRVSMMILPSRSRMIFLVTPAPLAQKRSKVFPSRSRVSG